MTFFSSKISLQFNEFLKNCSFFYPKFFGTHCTSWWDFHVHWKIILNVTQILGHKRKKKYLASFPCVCVCNMTMIIRHDFLCLKISMVVLCAEQCQSSIFCPKTTDSWKVWKICQNWLFLASKIRNTWIFAPKMVKNCHLMFFL